MFGMQSFPTFAFPIQCPDGEIGRRTVFRWRRREVCWFESSSGHEIFPAIWPGFFLPPGVGFAPGGYTAYKKMCVRSPQARGYASALHRRFENCE